MVFIDNMTWKIPLKLIKFTSKIKHRHSYQYFTRGVNFLGFQSNQNSRRVKISYIGTVKYQNSYIFGHLFRRKGNIKLSFLTISFQIRLLRKKKCLNRSCKVSKNEPFHFFDVFPEKVVGRS